MTRHSLTIEFAGICTHFMNGVVAGVPHRVVLPDATRFTTGYVSVADTDPSRVLYYVTPHFAHLAVPWDETNLNIPGLIDSGWIESGVRLQIVNACDTEMNYDGVDFGAFRSVTEFLPDYSYSSDVVLNGRAACYLDVYGGKLVTRPPLVVGSPIQVVLEVETEGPPQLLITPLAPAPGSEPPKSHLRHLHGDTLGVRNLEPLATLGDEEQEGSFDYLLHYLTARGGIPQSIVAKTPGMPTGPLQSVAPEKIGQSLEKLGSLLAPMYAASARPLLATPDDVTQSCADSHYP